jgi:hypothetical protein
VCKSNNIDEAMEKIYKYGTAYAYNFMKCHMPIIKNGMDTA